MRAFRPDKLRERRVKIRMTQGQLACKAGATRTYINEIEKGKKTPGANLLSKLAVALKVSEGYFFA